MPGRVSSVGSSAPGSVSADGRDGRIVGLGELGEAEVEHLELARGAHEQVRGLDVAVDDAALVRGVERARHLHREVDGLRDRDRALLQQLLDALPVAQLHDDERPSVVLPDVVDDADVRVVERGGEVGLAVEARERGRVGRHPRRQELERHVAPELCIVRTVDDTHPAGAQLGLDPIARDGLADHRDLMIAAGSGGVGRGVVPRRRRGRGTHNSQRTLWTELFGGLRAPRAPRASVFEMAHAREDHG